MRCTCLLISIHKQQKRLEASKVRASSYLLAFKTAALVGIHAWGRDVLELDRFPNRLGGVGGLSSSSTSGILPDEA